MADFDQIMDPERGRAAGETALAARRVRRETMVYFKDGWVLIEHDDGRIERVCKEANYRAEMVTARLDRPGVGQAPTATLGRGRLSGSGFQTDHLRICEFLENQAPIP